MAVVPEPINCPAQFSSRNYSSHKRGMPGVYTPVIRASPSALRFAINDTKQRSGKTIMVVDANEAIRLLMSYLLEEKGFNVMAFGDPDEALKYLLNYPLDLILSDHNMTGISGVRLLTIAKACHPQATLLLMSSDPSGISDNSAQYRVIEKKTGFFDNTVEMICSLCG